MIEYTVMLYLSIRILVGSAEPPQGAVSSTCNNVFQLRKEFRRILVKWRLRENIAVVHTAGEANDEKYDTSLVVANQL
jgi:hypothetical protein